MPTAGEAETFLEYKSKLDVFIFPSLLNQSKTNDILGPKYVHGPEFLCSYWNQENYVAFGYCSITDFNPK